MLFAQTALLLAKEAAESQCAAAEAALSKAKKALDVLLSGSGSVGAGRDPQQQAMVARLSTALRSQSVAVNQAREAASKQAAQCSTTEQAYKQAEALAEAASSKLTVISDRLSAATQASQTAVRSVESCSKDETAAAVYLKEALASFQSASMVALASNSASPSAQQQVLGGTGPGGLRRALSPCLAALHHNPTGTAAAVVHGWLNDLAWAKPGFERSLNGVLRGALATVVVVESRGDALQVVKAAKKVCSDL